ncbi:hypothetical protein LWI28_022846 [Acer negundo]|uniref:Uncharacterized protein n=1 Tax=Acer negundo TaxID=4023 RepID=A0AAD5JDX8_ACENE|nr:hypothetical protein LWI28_022846 [Acer negundo]
MQQQQQALMQQALLQQQSLYHPGLLAAPQIEPIPSGNLPPGFDPITCRSVYVGNIHTQVTEPLIQEVFSSTDPVEGRKSRHMDLFTTLIADLLLWLYCLLMGGIYLGSLLKLIGIMPVVRGKICQEAQGAINDLTGKWLGSRQIRCNWATKGAVNEDKPNSDAKSVVELTNGSSEDAKETTNNEAPENNPQYTTVYVGNLAPEVPVQRDKGFGFVRFSTHAEAALAIQMGNNQSYLYGKQIYEKIRQTCSKQRTHYFMMLHNMAGHMLSYSNPVS